MEQSEVSVIINTTDIENSSNNASDHHQDPTVTKQMLLPILTRFHAGYFRISLSLCGQALLWKVLVTDDAGENPHALRRIFRWVPLTAFSFLWSLALFVLASQSVLYSLRCVLRPRAVKAEFLHRVGVNYLFAPWISWLLLLQSSPFVSPESIYYRVLWWVFAVPIVVLDVKIYGQWLTKGKRFLSAVANPASHLSVIGNLAAVRAAAEMGWHETAVCMFAFGAAHYLVVFVTLYQRLSGNEGLPAKLRPVYFLFVGAPGMASLAWCSIAGEFDIAAKMLFFLSLFLFMSLVSRPALFTKAMRKFHVAWWGYSFPVTVLALASVEYAEEVKLVTAHAIMIVLAVFSFLLCFVLIIVTAFHSNMLLPDSDSHHTSASNQNNNTPINATSKPTRCDIT